MAKTIHHDLPSNKESHRDYVRAWRAKTGKKYTRKTPRSRAKPIDAPPFYDHSSWTLARLNAQLAAIDNKYQPYAP